VRRRKFVLLVAFLVPTAGYAQPVFIGQWQGEVEGIGKIRLTITAIRPNGQVEGRMEFDLQSFVSTFGDRANSAEHTNYVVVTGTALQIDSALGGRYDLMLNGAQLGGTYTRGTTFRGRATFTRQL
jgi:hypothetical protein